MRRFCTGGGTGGNLALQSHRTPVWIIFNWLEEDLDQSVESFEVERGRF